MNIKAIKDHILFEFLDRTAGGNLYDATKSGIVIAGTGGDKQRKERWVRVLAVGPAAERVVSPGQYALVEAFQWTNGVELDGQTYWKTDATKVMLVSDTPQLL